MNRDALVTALRRIPLRPVASSAVRKLGYDPATRMVAVVFEEGDTVYGYPNLSDGEITGLLEVIEQHESLGHFISTVIKPAHDSERVKL